MKLVDLINYRNSSPLTITIVSPFVSEEFIKTQVVEEFSPSEMLVVADKRRELEIDRIAKIAKVEVRLAECLDGLVHAKLFLFDWKDGAKFFVWGSANATQSAFGKNAESVSLYKIRDSNNEPESEIELYFKRLRENEPVKHKPIKIKSCRVTLDSMQFFLPEFSLIERQDNFDKWLEEGKLFNPETQSLPDSLTISLKKDYEITKEANDHGLRCQDKRTLTFEFSDFEAEPVPKVTNLSIMLKNYAAHTYYGYWIPHELIEWYKESGAVLQMDKEITELSDFMRRNKEELIAEMIQRLQEFSKGLEPPLDKYFEDEAVKGDELNTIHFQEFLRVQLEEHISKCNTLMGSKLQHRDIPNIRFHLQQWDDFAASWLRFIKEEAGKKSGHNKLSKLLVKIFSTACNSKPLTITELRSSACWKKLGFRQSVTKEVRSDWKKKQADPQFQLLKK
jgi:hypothetical protein